MANYCRDQIAALHAALGDELSVTISVIGSSGDGSKPIV
jgi:predicted RNA-binding protein with TRAM domain